MSRKHPFISHRYEVQKAHDCTNLRHYPTPRRTSGHTDFRNQPPDISRQNKYRHTRESLKTSVVQYFPIIQALFTPVRPFFFDVFDTKAQKSALPVTNELAFNLQHVLRAEKAVQFIIQRLTAQDRDSIDLYLHLSLKGS